MKQNNLLQKYIDQKSYSIAMKYYTILTIITFLLAINFTTVANAQITLSETQNQEIKDTCVLAPYVDPVTYLQVLKDSETPLTQEQQYEADCIETMISSYENNESHDEMMNKLADLWLDTFS